MVKERFVLKDPSADALTLIYLRMSFYDGRLKYSCKMKIHPKNWDFENQRPSLKIDDKEQLRKNRAMKNTLDQVTGFLDRRQTDYKLSGKKFGKKDAQELLDDFLNREDNEKKDRDFHGLITQYIEDCRSGKILTKQGKRYSKETLKSYGHTQDNLKKYESFKKIKLSFESITMDVVNDIVKYFNDTHDHSINSIGKIIKNLKVFIDRTSNHHSNRLASQLKIPKEETPDIYLPEEDIMKLLKLEISNKRHDLVRDRFILDCYLGLRISDMQQLSNKNISGNFFITANEKTDEQVIIPIHPHAKDILKKHGGIPRKVSDQEMNRIIKDVSRDAGLTDLVLYSLTKGGVRKDYYYQKWQMVSNHTARRTFITNLLKAGMDYRMVMKLTGIKKISTLERYNKMTAEENANLVAKHPFFQVPGIPVG